MFKLLLQHFEWGLYLVYCLRLNPGALSNFYIREYITLTSESDHRKCVGDLTRTCFKYDK